MTIWYSSSRRRSVARVLRIERVLPFMLGVASCSTSGGHNAADQDSNVSSTEGETASNASGVTSAPSSQSTHGNSTTVANTGAQSAASSSGVGTGSSTQTSSTTGGSVTSSNDSATSSETSDATFTSGSSTGETSTSGSESGSSDTTDEIPAVCPETFSNPLIWEDLPDLEVIRVDDAYYYTSSSFHHSPGAPILRSYDLVHWEYVSHSVPVLDFDPEYDLSGSSSYVNGIWASTLQYRKSNETFYWMGCMHGVGGGWVFTSKSPEGPWEKHSGGCYYDMGLLIDDDDVMYVASGNNIISVAELSDDGLSQVRSEEVFETPGDLSGPLEGSRFYKINGDYYIFVTQYANGEYVLRSTSGPFGPYELRPFAVRVPFAGAGAGGSPHQGGIVETQNGQWYYMGFNDSFPAGRIPVMAPMTWNDGWPSLTLVDGEWGASYPFPDLPCGSNKVTPPPTRDTFEGPELRPEWEWNHNPDNERWSANGGLTLQTATVTNDLYAARNTLTRRIEGPISIGTIEVELGSMQDGDVAGLAALRDRSAAIAVKKQGTATRVVMINGIDMDTTWTTTGTGTEEASADVEGDTIWLRVEANVRTDNGGGQAKFYFSNDGLTFSALGNTLTMNKDWQFFLGYRFGIFNYASQALGGSVTVRAFEVTKP